MYTYIYSSSRGGSEPGIHAVSRGQELGVCLYQTTISGMSKSNFTTAC